MLETGSPLDNEDQKAHYSVSPLSSLHASRTSTPGISSFDGEPRYLLALSLPQLPPHPASPQDMAIKPAHVSNSNHQNQDIKIRPNPTQGNADQATPDGSAQEVDSPEGDHGNFPKPGKFLSDLTHLLRVEKYQTRKCRQLQQQLQRTLTVAAKTTRLVHTARSVQRTLAECVKSEDKHSFVNLFNTLQDATLDCSEASKSTADHDWTENKDCIQYPTSFVDALPFESCAMLLGFLSKIRHDRDFIADRLAALTHRELVSLLPEKGQSRSQDSVFGSSPRTSSRSSRYLGYLADGQTELLSSFEYASPLETMICSVRGLSEPSLPDDRIATDLWASVCAKLISEQRPGSERLVPAIINIWASSSPWRGREELSLWISQVLRDGQFLLERASKQSFRLRVNGRQETSAEEDIRAEEFYANAVNSLLKLLGEPGRPSLIPEGALNLCQAIYQNLQHHQSHQQAFPNFVLTRWLFSSFLPDAITLPEIHGLMTDYFIPENARQRLLREVASRSQKAVFDTVYSWKLGNTISPEIAQHVRLIANRFQSRLPSIHDGLPGAFRTWSRLSEEENFLPVSKADIITLINAFYPQRRPHSISDRDLNPAGVRSSASSISGFSLFQNPSVVELGYKVANVLDHDATSATSLETPARGSLGYAPVLEPNSIVTTSNSDGEQLREVCGSIEDFSANGSLESSNWCVLLSHPGNRCLYTLRDLILETSKTHDSTNVAFTSNVSEVANDRVCKDAIQELLSEGSMAVPRELGIRTREEQGTEITSYFLEAFNTRIGYLQESGDFVAAHSWFRKLRCFRALFEPRSRPGRLLHILNDIEKNLKQSLEQSQGLIESCEAWLRSMVPRFASFNQELLLRADTAGRLRDKMWYVADVRTSGPYDEARSVASALKVMGKLKKATGSRGAPPLRHQQGSKVINTGLHLKTEAQVLDILSASTDHGGPNKLSDDQSKALLIWMEKYAVENMCSGEERLHKLCMEIRKVVDQLTTEGSTLLSSALFARGHGSLSPQSRDGFRNPFWTLQAEAGRFDLLTLRTNIPPSIDSMSSSSSYPLSASSSRDYLESRSPTVTTKSSAPFWSPVMTEARSPSSATSMGSSLTHAAPMTPNRHQVIVSKAYSQTMTEQLRERTTSLLISDLASTLFSEGSETDRAFWTGLGGELSEKHLRGLRQDFEFDVSKESISEQFDFEDAFATLVRRFSASSNPYAKLACLRDVDALLAPYTAQQQRSAPGPRLSFPSGSPSPHQLKRQGSMAIVDTKANGFRRLFCDPLLRPSAIFRDLQYIAALVPSSTLESTTQGRAFWNAAVAISGLKQEVREVMIETADSIIAYQSNNRGHGRSSSAAQQERDSATFSVPSRTPSAEDISRYTMADAAYLLQITAKEGDAVAQRELATLYLTHPELMDHIIAPLSRPRDVFKEELEGKWRKNQDPNRCDPTTMCVAHHWMSLSSKGGDALAKEYLRQRDEMDRLGL